jgi:hypothetical protein
MNDRAITLGSQTDTGIRMKTRTIFLTEWLYFSMSRDARLRLRGMSLPITSKKIRKSMEYEIHERANRLGGHPGNIRGRYFIFRSFLWETGSTS